MSRISLGQMTMYLMLFRQGQSAVSAILSSIGGMYEDNLYLSTLYEYLETPGTSSTEEAAGKGMADETIEDLPQGYETQLGKWFKGGQELSGGQWQKIALSRAFMRSEADILVLDEPTAAMDAAAEATIFEHFRKLTHNRIAILISHRFSTVRMAGQIIVIENGRIIERGSHEDLMELDGHYARLFSLQAAGYQ
jgi:ATP-binding cassette subfamily B protein